jgi:transposase
MTSISSTASTQPENTPQEVVVGVDTHKDRHVAAVLTTVGVVLASKAFPATTSGYQQLLAWAGTFGIVSKAGVEGTGSYGMALSRYLHDHNIQVLEVNQPDKATRRRRGKTDAIDAESAARKVISGQASALAKTSDGRIEAIRALKIAKDSAVKSRTKAINQLKAILVSAPADLRESLTGLPPATLIRRCAGLAEPGTDASDVDRGVTAALRLLARRIQQLSAEAAQLTDRIQALIAAHTPELLQQPGVGPDNAAALLITAGDNPQRLRHEASYAALCGASPVEASSGKTERLRLNRGGDRQANAALYRIALSRLRWDPRTRTYMHKRVSEGKTRREAMRCLKRYIAREIYQIIRQSTSDTVPRRPKAA